MPVTGGPSDKYGNRYEKLWTVFQLIRLLQGSIESIRLEDPSPEGDGVEFWLVSNGEREYYQVKRQVTDKGKWSLPDLEKHRILSRFWPKLQGTACRCYFISTDSAFELEEISDRARNSSSYQEFRQYLLHTNDYESAFAKLVNWWGCTREEAFVALKHVIADTRGEMTLRQEVEALLAILFEGNSASVRAILEKFIDDHIQQQITSHLLLTYLAREHQIYPYILSASHPVVLSLKEATDRYFNRIQREMLQLPIDRAETTAVVDILRQDEGPRRILLTGSAGVGKSNVIAACIKQVQALDWAVLALNIDHLSEVATPQGVGREVYQKDRSPAHLLALVAQNLPCLLIIDQLDAVSLVSGRRTPFFDVIREILDQARYYPNMRVLLAARTFDVSNDHRLLSLQNERQDEILLTTTIEVGNLTHEDVKAILGRWNVSYQNFLPSQIEMLRIPLHLRLVEDIAKQGGLSEPTFATVNDLYEMFCQRKEQDINAKANQTICFWPTIDALTTFMSDHQCLTAPMSVVDEWSADARSLASAHVLVYAQRNPPIYAFFHEGFFDYAFARRFALSGQSIGTFLLAGEQHLFRRAQVRQILTHRRQVNFTRYLTDVRELLTHPNIRFHLRQIVIAFLGSLGDPRLDEWNVLSSLVTDQTADTQREILIMLGQSTSWFHLLDQLGVWSQWLAQSEMVDNTVNLLRGHLNHAANRIAEYSKHYRLR